MIASLVFIFGAIVWTGAKLTNNINLLSYEVVCGVVHPGVVEAHGVAFF